ncbi:MAG: radical SAM protein [Candidatus Omnitrophica bacterium]|nr:radical SAM protein [Candidatus Omnitrophota bacterium]
MSEISSQEKILLIQAPPWGVDAPPLGIAYLATFLKTKGFPAKIFDLNIEIFHQADKELQEKWITQDFNFWALGEAPKVLFSQLENWSDRILSFQAKIIGFSATFASIPFLNALLLRLRKKIGKDVIIIIGGPGVNYKESRFWFRKDCIDYFVLGEGEYPLFCLLSDLRQGKTAQPCLEYITWKDNPLDHPLCLKGREENRININEIPFPTFEEFNLDYYSQEDLLPLISSRGCIRACAFCRDFYIKKPYRWRNPESVFDEIQHHVQKYKRKRFEFCDLLINGNLGILDTFCNLLLQQKTGIAWGGQAAVRRDMSSKLFKKMRQAGCGGLTFGCESLSDRVLKLMRKGITVRDARDSIIKAKKADIRVEINLIVGFPGETEQDIDKNIQFIRKNAKWIDKVNSLNICSIEPGMYLYEHAPDFGIDTTLINDWFAWFTKDLTNTLEIRLNRHKRLTKACLDYNLKPYWQNTNR